MKKILKYACIGFVLGMIACTLICAVIGAPEHTLVNPALIRKMGSTGNAILIQTLLSGLYGAIIWMGILLYDVEEMPLALATLLHYLCIALPYIPLSFFLGWVNSWRQLLVIELLQLAGFFVIWLIMDHSYKKQIKELNELQEKYREKDTAGTADGVNIHA